jgi:hypothetical protein
MLDAASLHALGSAWAICQGQECAILQTRDRPPAHTLWFFLERLRFYERLLRGVGGTPGLSLLQGLCLLEPPLCNLAVASHTQMSGNLRLGGLEEPADATLTCFETDD